MGETYHSHVDRDDLVRWRVLPSGNEVVDSKHGLVLRSAVVVDCNHVTMLIDENWLALYVPTHYVHSQVCPAKPHLRKYHADSVHHCLGMILFPFFHRRRSRVGNNFAIKILLPMNSIPSTYGGCADQIFVRKRGFSMPF